MKNKHIFLLILCSAISLGIGYNLGYYTTNNNIATAQFENVPKNELVIDSKCIDVEPVTYSINGEKEYLKTTISLTERGKVYLSKDLFIKEYDINVYLVNNSTDDSYLTFSDLEWNINEVKDLELLINKNDISDEKLLDEFNSQLEKVNKDDNNNLIYTLELIPKSNPDNIMRYSGILHKK